MRKTKAEKSSKSRKKAPKSHPVEGLDVEVGWANGYDPADWRSHPEPPGMDDDDDQDGPVPPDVFAITGIDPDKDW